MDYEKIYEKITLLKSGRRSDNSVYYEKHHRIPKCMGGSNDSSNLVLLTAREHYISHWLLTKIYPDDEKIWFAFSLMAGQMSPKGDRKFTMVQYERCKEANSKALSLRNKSWNPMDSLEAREKHSKRMKEHNPISKNPGLNHTACPVTLYMVSGEILEFDYGALAREKFDIPYTTWKAARRKYEDGRIPKYGVLKIIQHKDRKTKAQEEACEG